jgi:CRP-like cAMP-binding protein
MPMVRGSSGLSGQCPELERQVHRYGQKMAMQTAQIAACNRLHDVEERLARWFRMTQDRIESDQLSLTQEFLGQMLGTRRSSVTVAAGTLQKAGLISYTRGSLTISKPPETRRGSLRLLWNRATTA